MKLKMLKKAKITCNKCNNDTFRLEIITYKKVTCNKCNHSKFKYDLKLICLKCGKFSLMETDGIECSPLID